MSERYEIRALLADEAYDTVVPEVVQRSLELSVEEHQRGVFYVTGGSEPHWVNLRDPQAPRCDCVDHEARQRICKHLVGVLIYLGDIRLWRRLRVMQPEPPGSSRRHLSLLPRSEGWEPFV